MAIAMAEEPGQLVHTGGEAVGPRTLGRRIRREWKRSPCFPYFF